MIKTKKSDLDENFDKMNDLRTERFRIENDIKNLTDEISSTKILTNSRAKDIENIEYHRVLIESEFSHVQDQLHEYLRRLDIVSHSMTRITGQLKSIHDLIFKDQELFDLNKERNDNEIRHILHSITESKGQLQNSEGRLLMIDDEQHQIKTEANLNMIKSNDLRIQLESIENELREARDEEQKIIDSSRDSHGIFQEYEDNIRKLSENERSVSREYNRLEKENAILTKDITELETKNIKWTNDLNSLGYRITSLSDADYFDNLDVILQELTLEFDNLKSSINLRANESYTQVIQGYRSMSERKRDSQIIMVTLKDSTVAKANLIYGVYPHQGASQIVRYKHSQKLELNETISK
jgi:chromosome segregation protein